MSSAVALVGLSRVPIGQSACVASLDDLAPTDARRLMELGIAPGHVVTVVHRTAGGGRIVAVAEMRIALDRTLTDRIRVEPVPHAGSEPS